jgi:hypothetical protein
VIDQRERFERAFELFDMPEPAMARLVARRHRKGRNRRIGTAALALAVAAAGIGGLVRAFSPSRDPVPADEPKTPFVDTWVSTDQDGSTQTMKIRASGQGAYEIVVHDDAASVCSGAPSTMTGTGRLDGAMELVIPSPLLTCDEGSDPQIQSGPPLEEQLRNLTFAHDPESDTLTDSFGVVWSREGAEDRTPIPSETMWPQSSLEEVRDAQERADAGDPRYTWQVIPEVDWMTGPYDAEIFSRFLRDELGWEEFRGIPGYDFGYGTYSKVDFIRCAPGRTNPVYPNDTEGSGCAPTIDQVQYETVRIDAAQLVRQDLSGIWVVTGWARIPPLEQVVPPSEAETTALLESFLQARIEGKGAEEYVDVLAVESVPEEVPLLPEEAPLLHATTSGAPYERSEFEVVEGPVWPDGWMRVKARLFAEGGTTVVEQLFLVNRDVTGRLRLQYEYSPELPPTTENGQPVPVRYRFLDGEVTFRAAWPWLPWPDEPQGRNITTLTTYNFSADLRDARLAVVADPRPVESGCQEGPAPADAEALARSIRTDRDLEATAPATVSVGGVEALQMDVTAAPGASTCQRSGARPLVVTGSLVDREYRMRLYLLDLPGGSSRILAIAITAPKPNFERVMEEEEAAIVDSFEFHAR